MMADNDQDRRSMVAGFDFPVAGDKRKGPSRRTTPKSCYENKEQAILCASQGMCEQGNHPAMPLKLGCLVQPQRHQQPGSPISAHAVNSTRNNGIHRPYHPTHRRGGGGLVLPEYYEGGRRMEVEGVGSCPGSPALPSSSLGDLASEAPVSTVAAVGSLPSCQSRYQRPQPRIGQGRYQPQASALARTASGEWRSTYPERGDAEPLISPLTSPTASEGSSDSVDDGGDIVGRESVAWELRGKGPRLPDMQRVLSVDSQKVLSDQERRRSRQQRKRTRVGGWKPLGELATEDMDMDGAHVQPQGKEGPHLSSHLFGQALTTKEIITRRQEHQHAEELKRQKRLREHEHEQLAIRTASLFLSAKPATSSISCCIPDMDRKEQERPQLQEQIQCARSSRSGVETWQGNEERVGEGISQGTLPSSHSGIEAFNLSNTKDKIFPAAG